MRRDGIEDEARSLRDAVRGLGRSHPTSAIPHELRVQILAFASRAKTAGWSSATVAQTVEVSVGSIRNWRRDQRRDQRPASLVPVTVTANRDLPSAQVSVVGPSGYRVEGLSVSTAAALLRALE